MRELAAAYRGTQAHYSDDLSPRSIFGFRPGRSGNALCGWLQVFDLEALRAEALRLDPHSAPVDIASMPLCPRCEKKAGS